MRVLFVSSGRQGKINPIIQNQGDSLRRAGIEVDFYMVSGRGWKSYVKNIIPLRKQIKSGNYDVIHAHYAFCAYLVNIATLGFKKTLVVSLMGSDIWEHKWYPILVRTIATIAHWKAVIVKSKEMRDRVGISHAFVVPNGVDMERFRELSQAECQNKLGWDKHKIHVLFPADPSTARKNWPLAEGAVTKLNARGKQVLELHGMVGVKNEDTPVLYNAANAVVLPSFYEGSANAVKEAMACNVPIVTTDMGDCRERIEGVEGCYVANTYEVDEFSDLLTKALRCDKTQRLLADGIADCQVAERIIKIYEGIIE